MTTSALLPTFARADLSFERGEGDWLHASDGDAYLDFGGGIAVTSLGHSHPHLVGRPRRAGANSGTSPICSHPERRAARRRLVEATFADKVFFANSVRRSASNAPSRWRANIHT